MPGQDLSPRSESTRETVARGIGIGVFATVMVHLLPHTAEATVISVTATITMTPSVVAGHNLFDYFVTNTGSDVLPWGAITKIEIPEYHFGDLDFFGYGSVPVGWSALEKVAPTLTGATLPGGVAPGGYWLLQADDPGLYGLAPGDSLNFIADAVTASTQKANFAFQVYSGQNGIVDPPVPNTLTPTPEPASAAVLGAGLLGLLGLRRRTKG